jgi:hypothetical protein
MANVDLRGKVINQAGTAKNGLTVDLWEAANWETNEDTPGGAARTATTTTDADGIWSFGSQDATKVWLIVAIDGTKKFIVDGRNKIQLTDIDIISDLFVDTISEHTSGSGVTIDGVLLKALAAKHKASNETISNSNTLQNDDDLVFAMAANDVWIITLILKTQILTASDFQFKIVTPSGATGTVLYHVFVDGTGQNVAGVLNVNINAAINFLPGTSAIYEWRIELVIVNGSTAGNLQLQWAQVTAVAENTIVYAGSSLVAIKV